jgi:hypothetical protein
MRLRSFSRGAIQNRVNSKSSHHPIPVSTKMKMKAIGMVGLGALSGVLSLAAIKHAKLEQARLSKEQVEFEKRQKASKAKFDEKIAHDEFELENRAEQERMNLHMQQIKEQLRRESSNRVDRVKGIENKNVDPNFHTDEVLNRVSRIKGSQKGKVYVSNKKVSSRKFNS